MDQFSGRWLPSGPSKTLDCPGRFARAQNQTMERGFFQSIGAGGAIYLVHQRRARSGHENVRRVVFQLDPHATDEAALRQITQQRPEIDKGRVEILVDDARFRFQISWGDQFKGLRRTMTRQQRIRLEVGYRPPSFGTARRGGSSPPLNGMATCWAEQKILVTI